MSNANQSHLNQNLAHQENGKEEIDPGTASSDTFPAAFKRLPLLTATTRRNRLKTQSLLLRTFQARSRSIR